jgi:N-acetylmuramoyl-L-alanine amidase
MVRSFFLYSCLAVVILLCGLVQSAFAVDIYAVRVGAHPDKTRVVIELSGAPSYKVSYAQNPPRVIVDVKNATWQGQAVELPRKSGIIANIRQQSSETSHRIILQTKQPATVSKQFYLPANGGASSRYVIDLVSKEAKKSSAATEEFVTPSRPQKRKYVVVIDPGHGGKDPGAIGKAGTYEKDITLRVGLELRDALLRTGRYEVH